MEGTQGDLHISAAVHVDDGDTFISVGFRKGVFQRTSAITDPSGFPKSLGPVKVAKSHIMKLCHQGQVHLIGAADSQFFRFTALSTGYELMGQQDVSL